MDQLRQAFAGIWPIIAGYSTGMGIIAAALGFAWFSPIFKKTALWVALGATIITVSYGIGVSNGMARVKAQWDAAVSATQERIERARADAQRDIDSGVRDPRDRPDN